MTDNFKVGIDIGSTTIKVVVLDAEEHIVYKHYARHFSDIPTALVTNLTALKDVVGPSRFRFALTGSAGMGIAQRLERGLRRRYRRLYRPHGGSFKHRRQRP